MASTESTETRSVINFCVNLDMTPTQTMKKMMDANMITHASRSLIFKWHKRFKDGRKSNLDTGRGRRPIIGPALVTSVEEFVNQDRRVTVREVATEVGISYGPARNILRDNLEMTRVCARWVPRLLKDHEKERRVNDSNSFLRRYRIEGNAFLDRIITPDETWLWLFDPETKQQSSVWKRSSSPPPTEARVNKCGGKFMCMMFADRRGTILTHIVPDKVTINSAYYSKILRRDLVRALAKKRPGMPISHFLLHQDNAPPHVSAATRLELSLLDLETIAHPPYSPDLAPMDFAIFPQIKSQLKGRRFASLNDLRRATWEILHQYDESWYTDLYTTNGSIDIVYVCKQRVVTLKSHERHDVKCTQQLNDVTNVVGLRRDYEHCYVQ